VLNWVFLLDDHHRIVGLTMADHKAYLSYSDDRKWILIYQGSPLCDYKKSYDEVILAAKHYSIKLPEVSWDADNAQWIDTLDLRAKL
jgi:hypothetical protein